MYIHFQYSVILGHNSLGRYVAIACKKLLNVVFQVSTPFLDGVYGILGRCLQRTKRFPQNGRTVLFCENVSYGPYKRTP